MGECIVRQGEGLGEEVAEIPELMELYQNVITIIIRERKKNEKSLNKEHFIPNFAHMWLLIILLFKVIQIYINDPKRNLNQNTVCRKLTLFVASYFSLLAHARENQKK